MQAGKTIAYTNLSTEQYKEVLVGAGVRGPYADILVDSDASASRSKLDGASGDLHHLIGRPTTTFGAAVAAAFTQSDAVR